MASSRDDFWIRKRMVKARGSNLDSVRPMISLYVLRDVHYEIIRKRRFRKNNINSQDHYAATRLFFKVASLKMDLFRFHEHFIAQ